MTRIKTGFVRKRKHKKIIKLAQSFQGSNSKLFKIANQKVIKADFYSYFDRKKKKRKFRSLWIIRINSITKKIGCSYNKLINLLKNKSFKINRKILAEIIINDYNIFKFLLTFN